MREYNLWDDPVKSNEMLAKVADSAKVVDGLKDLAYKVILNWHMFKRTILVDRLHFIIEDLKVPVYELVRSHKEVIA